MAMFDCVCAFSAIVDFNSVRFPIFTINVLGYEKNSAARFSVVCVFCFFAG